MDPSFLIPFGLSILTFILCILFIAHDLPYSAHPDEPAVVYRALAMGRGDFNPHFFVYPSLWFYLLLIAEGIGIAFGFIIGMFHSMSDVIIATFTNPGYFFIIARIATAIMAGIAVFATYKTTERFSKFAGIVTALSVALFAPFITTGHFAVTDVPMTTMIAVTLYFIVRMTDENSSQKIWILASICLGLAVGIKYTAGVLVIPYLIALILIHYRTPKLLIQKIVLGGVISVVIFFMSSPYLFFNFQDALRDFKFINDEALTKSVNSPWHYVTMVWKNWGLPIIIYFLLGIIALLQKPETRKTAFVISSFIIAHLIVIHLADYKTDRFFLPLIPAIAVCIGFGAYQFEQRMKMELWRKSILVGLLVFLFTIPAIQVIKAEYRLSEIPASKQIRIWATEHIPSGSIIFEDHTARTLLPPSPETIEQKIALWQADATGRAAQFVGPYQTYLANNPAPGYKLIFTNDAKVRSFSAGIDESDYTIANAKKAAYIIADQQSIESTDEAIKIFYEYVTKNFTVIFTATDTKTYVHIYQKK